MTRAGRQIKNRILKLGRWRRIPGKLATVLRRVSRTLVPARIPEGLFPFVLPWDDATPGPTNLSGWNRPIEGESDRLRLGPDGRLYRGADRMRLLGFDIASGAAFPDQRVGQRVAARLARLGVNYVRIGQSSNLAPAGWLDPATAGCLDPEAMDRLDGFVAQLRRRGIYVHLVLNHFRRVYPSHIPGFEAERALPQGWPPTGAGVTQFFSPVVVENRAMARELLTRRNRWTGLTYADDPAIAVVEVSNEDGLVLSWREGALDSIIAAGAPHLQPLHDELQTRWNEWLRQRYPDDRAVRDAWAWGASAGGGQLLTNGDFQEGDHGWRLATPAGVRAQLRVMDGGGPGGALPAIEVQVDRTGTEGRQVVVAQDQVRLEKGRTYGISLWARAARLGARLTVSLQQAQPPRRSPANPSLEWTLTDRWARYIGRIAAGATEAEATLHLTAGHDAGTIWIADASVRESPASGLRADESPARGTVPPMSRAGSGLRTLPAQRDWMAFLFDTERRFFTESFEFLRHELRVRSLLVGTQGDWSPVAAQAGSDVASMHAYWGHPYFPAREWDPDDWFVQNRSIVTACDEWHTLNRISFHRPAGKPLLVDEYNHPQPNSFGAEGLPLAAAYGAFQDWDGIAGWAYREGWGDRWLARTDWAQALIRNHFALDTDPVRLVSAWLAAVIFRRGDVAPGFDMVPVGITADLEREIGRTVGLMRRHEIVGPGAERLPLRHRVALQTAAAGIPTRHLAEGTRTVSDTGELAWDAHPGDGVVTINTSRTKAVIGFAAGREFRLGPVTLRPGATRQQGFGLWAVTALDGAVPIGDARRLVIVALGYSQNTEQAWKIYPGVRWGAGPPPAGTAVTLGTEWGRSPTLAEGIPAQITLPATSGRLQAWALDERGRRKRKIPVRIEHGRAVVEIDPRYRTLWYEVLAPGVS